MASLSGTLGLWQPKGCGGRGGSRGSIFFHSQSGIRQPSSLFDESHGSSSDRWSDGRPIRVFDGCFEIPSGIGPKLQIDRLVGEINGRYTTMGWVPVHYMFRSLGEDELLAYYRACGIGLVTPLKDGMNLVCKEFCACSNAEDSVLILSQFAGAAAQLGRSALLVNPYDVEQTADAMYRAFRMLPDERSARMRKLQRNVREQDIFWWVDSFMRAAIDRELKDFPVIEEYVPEYHEEPHWIAHEGT